VVQARLRGREEVSVQRPYYAPFVHGIVELFIALMWGRRNINEIMRHYGRVYTTALAPVPYRLSLLVSAPVRSTITFHASWDIDADGWSTSRQIGPKV
jgi:hypothetical protein